MDRTVSTARRWTAAGAGAIGLLAYIVALGNQWVQSWWTGRINAVPHAAGRVLTTLASVQWRASPIGGHWSGTNLDLWIGQVVTGVGMFLLVLLLVRWILRGVTVERSGATIFLSTWTLTALAGGVAVAGGTAVANRSNPGGGGQIADASVSDLPTGLFFGAMLGLLVGLLTTVVFVTGRRVAPQEVEREYPGVFGDDDDATHISALTQPVIPRGAVPAKDQTLPYGETYGDTTLPPI